MRIRRRCRLCSARSFIADRTTAGFLSTSASGSTDCVFSGRRGAYSERDAPDAEDLYGKSKFLGEVAKAVLVFKDGLVEAERLLEQ